MDSRTREMLVELGAVLEAQLAEHEKLTSLLEAKRAALRTARYRDVADACERENAVVQAISSVEKRRLQLVADLTLALDPHAARPLRMAALAARLGPPEREHLLDLRQRLVAGLEASRQQMGVARRATEALVRHMQGLMQTIGTACSGTSVYGRTGAPPGANMPISTFNTTA